MLDERPMHSLHKYVPTDMDWAPSFEGYYAEVTLYTNGPDKGGRHHVAIHGGDDTALVRFFDDVEEARALFNSITYLQSHADCEAFNLPYEDPRNNNNGWPGERPIFPADHVYPYPTDEDWLRPHPLPPRS
jgi:hypothetical protein